MSNHKKTMRVRDLMKVVRNTPDAWTRMGKGDHILVGIGGTTCVVRAGQGSRPVDRRVLSQLRNAGLPV